DSHLAKEWPDVYDTYDPVVRFGEHGGIYQTTDGGKTFTKVTKGLPTSKTGRISLDWYRKDPKVVFAIVDCENIGKGTAPKKKARGRPFAGFAGEEAETGYRVVNVQEDGPAAQAGLRIGDVITAINDKAVKTFDDFRTELGEFSAGDKVTFSVRRDS